MKRKKLLWTILGLIFLLSMAIEATGQTRQSVRVSGRAVDQNGVAITDVRAILYSPPCRGCIDNVIPANPSFNDGAFFVDSSGTRGTEFTLYLEEVVPPGFWSPIGGAPYFNLDHLPEFRGMRIRHPRKSSEVELGDVEVKIRYGKVILEVPESWKDLAPESTPLRLRLRDRTGALIYNGKLPLTTATAKSDSVKLALTPGRWKVQLLLDHKGQRLSSPVRPVVVKPTGCETITLTKNSSPEPCSK